MQCGLFAHWCSTGDMGSLRRGEMELDRLEEDIVPDGIVEPAGGGNFRGGRGRGTGRRRGRGGFGRGEEGGRGTHGRRGGRGRGGGNSGRRGRCSNGASRPADADEAEAAEALAAIGDPSQDPHQGFGGFIPPDDDEEEERKLSSLSIQCLPKCRIQ